MYIYLLRISIKIVLMLSRYFVKKVSYNLSSSSHLLIKPSPLMTSLLLQNSLKNILTMQIDSKR